MSKALDAFYDLMDVYFDNDIVKEKYGITEKTAKEKYKIVETALKEKGKQDLILNFLKEHIVFEGDVVKADFQWIIDDKETEKAVKEWLK